MLFARFDVDQPCELAYRFFCKRLSYRAAKTVFMARQAKMLVPAPDLFPGLNQLFHATSQVPSPEDV